MHLYYRSILVFLVLTPAIACKTGPTVKVDASRSELIVYSTNDASTAMAKGAESATMADVKENLTKESKISPDNTGPLINLAQLQLARGELDDAEATVRSVLRKNLKNEAAKLILASVYFRRGMIDMASIILDGLGGGKSNDSHILNLMGLIALARNDNSLALALFTDAVRKNSSDLAARMNLGVSYLKYHQLQEAALQFERVLSILPQHEDAKMHMAAILTNRGQYSEAKDLYKAVFKADKKNPVALYNYAVLQSAEGEYEDAISTLKSCISSSEGKSAHTDRAFLLITEIQTKMAADGKQISNEEIDQLAKDLGQKEAPAKPAKKTVAPAESESATTNSDSPAKEPAPAATNSDPTQAKKTEAAPVKKVAEPAPAPKAKPKPASENVDDLEKELMK